MTPTKPPFVHEDAKDSTGFLLWQVTSLWQRKIAAALRPFGLTQVQFVLLASLLWLGMGEALITQVMLATHAKLDVMMTSQVLRALEARGLVERQSHPQDSRAKVLHLTASGRALVSQAIQVVDNVDTEFFARLGKKAGSFNTMLQELGD